uniref:Cytochrome c domain-containing protein n=1 Tax=uncultured Armatimonadetes bacterium TaxID=157466 RepID=A0A6J4HBN4_9BACT|nr:hypothetical protein AVDCRST_MAG63-325 [uncultured Armatimonadetes bacterium]
MIKPVLPLLFLLAAPVVATRVAPDPPAAPAARPERFDKQVRNDFFSGFGGDVKALERGMAACEKVLEKEPGHPEALVWHGCGTVFRAGRAFRRGDYSEGTALWQKGLDEMDRAVKLAPSDIAVRIPRATCLIPASRNAPAPRQRALLLRAREDLETVYRVRQPVFSRLSGHSRGELLMGLAEVYKRLGEEEKAKRILDRVARDLASTPYAEVAGRWLKPGAAPPAAKFEHSCIGCHG